MSFGFGFGFPKPRSVSGASFPLDGIVTPNFAYALFPLTAAFVGQPVARVRDVASGFEANVLGSVDGNITDASPINTLSGGSGGTLGAWRTPGGSLAVKTLYQQGAVPGVDLVQSTATSQPLIMSSGSYITIGTAARTVMQSIGSAGANASLESSNGFGITLTQASVDGTSSTFMTVQRANPTAASGNQIFLWYGAELSLYLGAVGGTDYYLDMPATAARINGTWSNKDVAAVVTAWRSGANMALLRNATTIGSRADASTSIGAGPSNLLLFPTVSPDYYASCFISWPTKIADASITTASARLESSISGSPPNFPLNLIGGALPTYAFSWRAMRADFVGQNHFELRRSGDNTTQIFTCAGKWPNTAAVAAWVAAGGGTQIGTLRQWWNQGSRGGSMTADTTGLEATVFSGGAWVDGFGGSTGGGYITSPGYSYTFPAAPSIASLAGPNGNTATFAAIVKRGTGGNQRNIFAGWDPNLTNSYVFWYSGDPNFGEFQMAVGDATTPNAGGSIRISANAAGPAALVGRRDAANMELRTNGVSQATRSNATTALTTTLAATNNVRFQHDPSGGGFISPVGEVVAWPRALSPGEIAIYEASRADFNIA